MRICLMCHWLTVMDDVVLAGPTGRCICLRCYTRETNSGRPLPRLLREELIRLLDLLEAA
jgi:hypothetical protein